MWRIGATAVVGLALLASQAHAAWAPPQRLAGPGDEGTHDNWLLAGNSAGHRLLAYDTEGVIRVRSARPGRGFGGEVTVPRSAGGDPNSAAISARGDAILGWSYFVGEEFDTCCWRLAVSARRAGRGFGARRTLTPADEDTSFVDVVAGPRGHVAVGAVGFENTYGVFGRFGSLGARRVVPRVDCCGAHIAVDAAGRTQFSWPRPDSRDVMALTRSRSGDFGRARRIYRSPAKLLGAGITSDRHGAAALTLLEHTREPFSRRVRLTAAVRGRDGRFGARRELAPPGDLDDYPLVSSATADSGASVVAWSPRRGEGEVVRAALRRPGRAFGRPLTLRAEQYEGRLFEVATGVNGSGLTVVAWRAITPEESVGIYAAAARPGRGFGEPVLVSDEGGGLVLGRPEVLVDRAGRVTVAWQQGQSIVAAVYRR